MAKKQLKKLNQPKKYLQGGSNMSSVAQMKQNPYYLGQVEAGTAEDQFQKSQNQLAQARLDAAQAQKEATEESNQQLDATVRAGAADLVKATATDRKAGRLGKLFSRGPLSGQAALNLSAGTQVAPMYAAPATTTVASNVGALTPGAVEVGANLANTSTNVVSGVNAATAGVPTIAGPTGEFVTKGIASGAKGATGLSSLASAGIGAAATIGGQLIERGTNDKSAYTFTDKERRGNVGGSALASAGTGFGIGNMILPGVGGAIGAGIGAGVGALKARKENKAAEEEAQRLQREQAAIRGAYQGAFVNSRLTGADTGFGLNSSTNMNNQFTNQFQVAKLGGVKKVPGGQIVPIEGTDAVEFKGRSHENGGVIIDKNTEVEGGETMDQVAMNDNNKQDYIFSKYLKLGGKSFAQRHKEILKGSGSQAEIQQLAAMQEKVAGRDSKQVAAYGGFHKYLDGGAVPDCPPGMVYDVATGQCVPDEDTPSSYDWNATGLDGFKAKQNAAAPTPAATPTQPTGPTASKADMEAAYQDYMMGKKADELRAAQNAAPSATASNAPTDNKVSSNTLPKSSVTPTALPGLQSAEYAGMGRMAGFGRDYAKDKFNTTKAESERYDATVKPPANTQPAAQTDNTVAPDGTKLPAGYVWDATLNAPVSATAMSSAAEASANKTGTATYTAPTGVTPNPTVTYVNSKDPNAPVVEQTPEEKEAARLAGLPRMFMGASRKVDEATGNVTIDKGKPLMGVGAMAGSRLGTATGSQEELAKVTRNSYDQAWTNKADNLYTNQKDASGGGLSSSDAIADRDKIAESNWGQKYGYKKGMSADEAKAAHGKFAQDVKSLFASNPDEMLGYFQYIVDGGDPKNTGSYLGKDAEQIRNNLTKKGFIGADGRPIAGKEKEMTAYLETQATNNAVGPIHNALGSYTAERGSTRIKLEEQKKKEVETPTQELPKAFEPCPPGTYRSGDGTCKPVGDVPQGNKISGTLMAGLGQMIPVGAALANPYKIAPGITGAPSVKGALMPRMTDNAGRAAAIQNAVAMKNAVVNQNAGPGALAVLQGANAALNDQMLKIAKQEQTANTQLAAEEGKLGMQASMFNAEADQKRQMFNTEFNQGERRYRREDILGALDTGASRIAGIVKDERAYKADERLANALDETGSYDRFTILEQLNKEAKRKNSPYANTTEAERRRIAAAMHKQLNPEGYVGKSEYNKLQEEKAKLQKEKDDAEKEGKAKFGGARQYVSRLGELKGVRGTKAKL
jgi:hypothetical protein